MKTNNKAKKFKRAGALLAVVGGLVLGASVVSKENVDEDVKNMRHTVKNMNYDEKSDYLKKTEALIIELQQRIDSDETDAEERFEARQSVEALEKERAALKKILSKEKSRR